jgi:peroxiredoxin Q/BCP
MSEQPREGHPAPEFELPDQSGTTVKLADFRGRQHVVLYFYPKDDTPGCTREACDFRDAYDDLTERDVAILGVSRDAQDSHARFAEKYGLPFTLLSDTGGDVSERYGVLKERTVHGRPSRGIERTTFLIDKEGVLRRMFPQVRVEGHVGEIAAAVDALGA